ncbi:MAG: hypothetical protein IKR59_02055, partial [Lachnospiraceae bacterium]|nr:hypothetical protein [Lachnospiraceae bacterium]
LFGLRFDPDRIPEELNVWGSPLSGNYVRQAQKIQTEDILHYGGPILFVHGEADERVPAEVSVLAAGQCRDAEVILIPGESHDFEHCPGVMADAAAKWLAEHCSAPLNNTSLKKEKS